MSKYPLASEIMRAKRPYLFSDSSTVGAYTLSRSEFSHHLDSLTQRNEHKDFEIFCRHLCERVLCPNLRTQTGPEGGGDGKVDTETYVVSSEVSDRWLSGEANAGQERWAFAISAQEKWSPKVKKDVEGIVGTGRKYDRIYFLTSRPVKAKLCHEKEMALTREFGVPVTIFDREWIIEKTFQNKCEDLAFYDLGAGIHDPSKVVVGPEDYRRQQALNVLEQRLAKPSNKLSDNTQAISDAYEAARMSRELDRPRLETEMRYLRAIRLSESYGSKNQVLRVKYESVWTTLWWHDDVEAINQAYEEIEEMAFETDEAFSISKVCNLMQVLAARVSQGWETATHLQTNERHKRLMQKLDELSKDRSRPNNALYAETLLVMLGLSDVKNIGNSTALDDVWKKLSGIIDRAKGLGEYPADMVDEVVEGISTMLPESKPLDALLEQLAVFMGERHKEGKAGAIYLKRGNQKLEIEEPMEAIYWLGRASVCFTKEEYRQEQFESLYGLAIAYRGAGLLWAARSVCLSALVQLSALSAVEGDVRIETIPTVSLFAMICLQLGRVPDFLLALHWLLMSYNSLPLADESKEHLEGKVTEFDGLFSCFLAALDQKSLHLLQAMPDILDALGLYVSKTVLMYRLGHAGELKKDGLVPQEASDEEIKHIIDAAASQPACQSLPRHAYCNQNDEFDVTCSVLGVTLRCVGGATEEDILLCEAHLTALESFFATAFTNGILPQTDKLTVQIIQKKEVLKSSFEFNPQTMTMTVIWPSIWSILDTKISSEIVNHLIEVCAQILPIIAVVPDMENTLEKMFRDERLFERTGLFSLAHFSHSRMFGRYASKVNDLGHFVKRTYSLLEPLPMVEPFSFPKAQDGEDVGSRPQTKSHSDYKVNSIINTHLWDKAGWCGLLFAHQGPQSPVPPVIGLYFSNREMAEAIFQGWKEEVGDVDQEGLIRVALLRGIDRKNEHHYEAHISKSLDSFSDKKDTAKMFVSLSRHTTMEPKSSENLDMFLDLYDRFGAFYLMPAIVVDGEAPELLTDLSILKRDLVVRQAWEVGQHDQDSAAIRTPESVIIPEGVDNPPCLEIVKLRNEMINRDN
ncbi:MAG: hypothetical protein ABJV68_06830 [Paracoccaceae bacterium]